MTNRLPSATVLVDAKTRRPVAPGDTLTDFRGNTATLVSFSADDGQVYARSGVDDRPHGRSFYPSVFGLEFAEPVAVSKPSRFWTMPSDPEAGHPEPFGEQTWGVVDEKAGGVVAWVLGRDAADDIATALNSNL